MVALRQMRLFVAVNFSDETRRKIGSLIDELRLLPCNMKWVNEINLHLTVQFLGNVPEGQVALVADVLQRAAVSVAPFRIDLGGCGVFPKPERPQVFWLGISGDVAALSCMHGRVQKELNQLGFKTENRRFSPHLTLARVRSAAGFAVVLKKAEYLVGKQKNVASEVVGSIELMLSELSPKGPKYTVLSKARLG